MEAKLNDVADWSRAVTPGLPVLQLPTVALGVAGVYALFDAQLQQLRDYSGYKGLVQDLRELGNALAFLRALDRVMRVSSHSSMCQYYDSAIGTSLGVAVPSAVIIISFCW
jgi:Cytoplasmic Fragile-X interacting family